MKQLAAVLVVLGVVGVGRAGEKEIIERLEKGKATAKNEEIDGEQNSLYVCLGGEKMTDANLTELCELPRIRALKIYEAGVTDSGMRTVGGLTGLKVLALFHNPSITDAGVTELKGLRSLKSLSLVNIRVTDVGLKELAGLEALQFLALNDSVGVTDASIETIARLKNLREVWLFNSTALWRTI